MNMTYNEIVKDIKAKKYKAIYFLCGEEPYFIDVITDMLELSVLKEDEKAFNQTILYGNEVNMTAVTDSARRFPMMSEKQLIIVKEAQNIRDFDNLIPYINHFQETTILVFAYKNKKGDKRKEVFKKLNSSSHCVYLETAKLYDDKIPAWIMNYCKDISCGISSKAASLLSECLGTDLSKLVNEIDKLKLIVPEGKEINEELVEENIGISKDFNNFELVDAVTIKDTLKANRIVNYFTANPSKNPMVLTISALFIYFSNLLTYHYEKRHTTNNQEMARLLGINPYFMNKYITGAKHYSAMKCAHVVSLLREYDMKSKGGVSGSITHGELLKELVFKILH